MYGRFKDHLNAELQRIRVQISAAHTPDQIAFALGKFGRRLGAI